MPLGIVFSGGNANLIADDSAKEADYALSALESLGVAKERLDWPLTGSPERLTRSCRDRTRT